MLLFKVILFLLLGNQLVIIKLLSYNEPVVLNMCFFKLL